MESLSTPARRRSGQIGTGVAIVIAVVLLVVGIGGGYALENYLAKTSTKVTQLTETGSTLLYPLMKIWAPNYTAFNPSVTISTVGSGSGTGQSAAENGKFNIGASDAYVSNFSQTHIINVPVAISAQLIYYNLPGVTQHLRLNGTMLAMIYGQAITHWTNPLVYDAQTTTVQTEINALPSADKQITLIKRGDSSGDTFLFSSLCYLSWSGFPYTPGTSALSGLASTTNGSSVVLPETGNGGMVKGIEGTPGGIAYIGISYASTVTGSGISYAAVGDNESLTASGGLDAANYVLPLGSTGPANISADANLALQHLNYATDGLAISLILGGVSDTLVSTSDLGMGGTNATPTYPHPYPIVNLEYALIKTAPATSTVTSSTLADTVAFLEWAISLGNAATYLNQVAFVPLTTTVLGLDMSELGAVST